MSDATTAGTTDTTSAAAGDGASATATTTATQATDTTGATTQTTTGNEPQDAGAKQGDGAGEQGKDGKSDPVYEYKMPEGVQLNQTAADKLTAFAKENGIAPEKAQMLADIGAQMVQHQREAHAQTVKTWIDQVKTDKDIGGDKFEASLATARSTIESFGTPELKDVLNATGLGNHPAVVKFFYEVGKRVSQDEHVTGNSSPNRGEKDPAKIMFPEMA